MDNNVCSNMLKFKYAQLCARLSYFGFFLDIFKVNVLFWTLIDVSAI